MRISTVLLLAALVLAAAPLQGQGAKGPPRKGGKMADSTVAAGPTMADTLHLLFDREVYSYPATPRRDPFTPLVGKNDTGPRFEDLSIKGIIFVRGGDSLVLLSDGKKVYRRHRGEMVGNARVVEIEPTRVIFAVDNFGTWRQESLDLKKNPEGDKG
jgi:hypothetical protein